jgi:hypothetical protein
MIIKPGRNQRFYGKPGLLKDNKTPGYFIIGRK